jgi:hypothetical protein
MGFIVGAVGRVLVGATDDLGLVAVSLGRLACAGVAAWVVAGDSARVVHFLEVRKLISFVDFFLGFRMVNG